MDNTLEISICLTLYKPNLVYLKELVTGIRNQTFQEFEIIISDNDDSESIVRDYFKGLNYRYYKNEGPKEIFYNVNNTIRKSKGQYLQFLCQDDVMLPTMLEKQLSTLKKYSDCKFIYTQTKKINENSEIVNDLVEKGIGQISKKELGNYLFVFGCLPGNLSTVMVAKYAIIAEGLFDTSMNYASDFNMWIRLSRNSGLAINYEGLLLLRTHDNQASFTLPSRYFIRDMNRNTKILFQNSDFSWLKKYIYINATYGKTIFIKGVKSLKHDWNFGVIWNLIRLSFPLHIFTIILITICYYLGLKINLNFGNYNTFPGPINKDK